MIRRMSKTRSWEVAPGLFLVCHSLSVAAAPPPPPEPTHHIVVIDCSGSMSGELPRIREQLNDKLVSLLGPDDAISIIWFSGRGQCDVLREAVQVGPAELQNLRAAVNRWLVPVGLTGFKEPIELAGEVMRRLRAKGGTTRRTAVFFMSDGYDNVWPRPEILRAIDALRDDVHAATVVKYGYYADGPFLTKMAERWGGTLIDAVDFNAYEPAFAAALAPKGGGVKKQTAVLDGEPVGEFVFAVDGKDLLTYGVDVVGGGKAGVVVPAHLSQFFYLAPAAVGEKAGSLAALAFSASKGVLTARQPGHEILDAAYAAMALFAQRVRPTIIWALLRALGDAAFIDDFSLCIGKQRYSAFHEQAKAASAGAGWFTKGYDPKRAPREDAFTVIDLFEVLSGDPRCRILTDSDAYQYSRIGRKSVTKDLMLTVTEADDVKALLDEAKALVDGRLIAPIAEAVAKVTKALTGRKAALKFRVDPVAGEAGFPIDGLVWNEDMPNLSFRVKKPGTVDLAGVEMSAECRAALPPALQTFQYRAYTVVKDGLVHIEWLPVYLPRVVYETLVGAGIIDPSKDAPIPDGDGVRVNIDMRKLPVVNQKMVANASARALGEMAWETLKLEAAAKVFRNYKPERESTGFQEKYGPTATAWLAENKVTEGGGYNPQTTRAPAVDFYIGRSLAVKIPGFSKLPSVADVRERMPGAASPTAAAVAGNTPKKAGKAKAMTPVGALMVPALEEVDRFMASPEYTGATDPQAAFNAWIMKRERETTIATRKLQTQMAKTKFAILLTGNWFKEFSSFDEHTLRMDLGGEAREVDFVLDENVKIEQ